jgi:MRG
MHQFDASFKADDGLEGSEILPSVAEAKRARDTISPKLPDAQEVHPCPAILTEFRTSVLPPLSEGKYNVFEATSNCSKKSFLYLAESIEKGQSVRLCFFPGTPFAAEWLKGDDNMKARRWIRDRIATLSLKELRALQAFLEVEIAPPIFRQMEDIATSPVLTSTSDSTSLVASGLIIARRRVHWIATLVNELLHNQSDHNGNPIVRSSCIISFEDLYWNRKHLSNFCSDSGVLTKVTREIEEEIMNTFQLEGLKGFAGTRALWCRLAERLFRRVVLLCAAFSASFEDFSTEDEFSDKVCAVVAEAIEDLTQASLDGSDALEDLVLTFKEGVSHDSNALPSVRDAALSSYTQLYADAMNLVGEPKIDLPRRIEYEVVATIATAKDLSNEECTRLLSLNEVRRDNVPVDLRWYLDRQVLAVVQSAVRCAQTSFPLDTANDSKALDKIESKVLKAAQTAMADPELRFFALESSTTKTEFVKQINLPEGLEFSNCKTNYQPHSSQFFLGLVWPILSSSGWRLCAGDCPSDVVYFPPDCGSGKMKASQMKKEITRQSAGLARDIAGLGLGCVPKLTKRLVLKCVREAHANETKLQSTESRATSNISVSSALRAFEVFLEARLRSNNQGREGLLLGKTKDVVLEISSLFEEVAQQTFFDEERCNLGEKALWSDILGCDYLMRLLILFPNILKEADAPIPEYDQAVCVVRELIDFLARNHINLFSNSFHLPKEEYDDDAEDTVISYLPARIMKSFPPEGDGTESSDADHFDEQSKEVVHPKDRRNLTDFVVAVMSQVVIFRAKQDDVSRKGRRILFGHPGLVCRHCLGQNGEGKYFFGSTESMTTAATVIEKHLLRCPNVPGPTRKEIVGARACHAAQRKGLKAGIQGAFFARLFDRLRSMRVSFDREGDESEMHFLPRPSAETPRNSIQLVLGAPSVTINSRDISEGFKSHLDVMNFLQCTEPWKSMEALVEMVEKYYNCLEYGGKIYNTTTMPSHFSSEWLYAKVAPRK